MAEHLCSKAVNYIKENKEKPFFLYYATHNTHEQKLSEVSQKLEYMEM